MHIPTETVGVFPPPGEDIRKELTGCLPEGRPSSKSQFFSLLLLPVDTVEIERRFVSSPFSLWMRISILDLGTPLLFFLSEFTRLATPGWSFFLFSQSW